jgi:cation transport regulator
LICIKRNHPLADEIEDWATVDLRGMGLATFAWRAANSIRAHLPDHAQDIYREAFNHAWAAHAGDPRQEEAAHRIAWAAVKRSYVKAGADWVPRHP